MKSGECGIILKYIYIRGGGDYWGLQNNGVNVLRCLLSACKPESLRIHYCGVGGVHRVHGVHEAHGHMGTCQGLPKKFIQNSRHF